MKSKKQLTAECRKIQEETRKIKRNKGKNNLILFYFYAKQHKEQFRTAEYSHCDGLWLNSYFKSVSDRTRSSNFIAIDYSGAYTKHIIVFTVNTR